MKKKNFLVTFLVLIFCLFFLGTLQTYAADNGKISGTVNLLPNNIAREYHSGNGIRPGSSSLYLYNGMGVNLLDENNQIVKSMRSGEIDRRGGFSFEGLPLGNYYVELQQTENQLLLPYTMVNSNTKTYKSELISLTTSQQNITDIWWVLVNKPYSFKTVTNVGSFSNSTDTKEKIYFPGGLTTIGMLNSFDGVLYGDVPGNIIKDLEVPNLSMDEVNYGYVFKGWKTEDSDEILSTDTVLNSVTTSDKLYQAVFDAPKYSVDFSTNKDYGYINDSEVKVTYNFEGNTSKISALPTVTAKEGYKFIGWYTDLTTNIVENNDILDSLINKNITYYAKYESITNPVKNLLPILRAYNKNNGDHLYTISEDEYNKVVNLRWQAEGTAFNSVQSGYNKAITVYRLYNPNSGEHFYTLNKDEYEYVYSKGWNKEGTGFYMVPKEEGQAIYRVFNPNANGPGSHLYTKSKEEVDGLIKLGWKNEDIAFYSPE